MIDGIPPDAKYYIGDGVYVKFDSNGCTIMTPRDYEVHYVCLDRTMLTLIKQLWDKHDKAE